MGRKRLNWILILYIVLFSIILLGIAWDSSADDLLGKKLDPLKEYRTCTIEPKRDKNGKILRRKDVLLAYRKIIPCPSTMSKEGPCPGYALDHIKPLACGGCDAVFNLTWLAIETKSCGQPYCKDRWERKVYCHQP